MADKKTEPKDDLDKREAALAERERKIDSMLARLEAREEALARAEEVNAGRMGQRPQPMQFQPEPNVRRVRDAARGYLEAHHYQAGMRELQLIEAIAHAFFEFDAERSG